MVREFLKHICSLALTFSLSVGVKTREFGFDLMLKIFVWATKVMPRWMVFCESKY